LRVEKWRGDADARMGRRDKRKSTGRRRKDMVDTSMEAAFVKKGINLVLLVLLLIYICSHLVSLKRNAKRHEMGKRERGSVSIK
jgi:hypothetical protein